MDYKWYQESAQRTSSTKTNEEKILNARLGLMGETGELADLLKKYKFQSGDNPELPREKIVEEIGDVCWYIAEAFTGIGQDMQKAVDMEWEKAINASWYEKSMCDLIFTVHHVVDGIMGYLDQPFPYASVLMLVQLMRLLDILASICRSSLTEVLEANIAKLKKRYPDGFDAERSINREKYEGGK